MYYLRTLFVFCILATCNANLLSYNDPIVNIKSGGLKGKTLINHCLGQYFGFFGIPYAKPPVNELRFKSPQPPDKWKGIRNANLQGNKCVQKSFFGNFAVGNEDCLYANVFTKQLPNGTATHLKPVIVFVHGGGLTVGSSDHKQYGSQYFMCEDIVLVTFNYRLNVFGFLSLEDPSVNVPGNAGIKDQIRLLHWVQENIIYFSGDPNSVTIFGQSAGASSVHLLMLSPLAKGLFHRAISDSGTALQPFVFTPRRYRELAEILNYNGDLNDQNQIYNFLKTIDSQSLLFAQKKLRTLYPVYLGDHSEIAVIIENKNGNSDPLITQLPEKIIVNKLYNDVPYLLGFNSEEGSFYLNWDTSVHYNFTDNQETAPRYLNIEKNTSKAYAFGNKIKKFYYGDEIPSYKNLNNYYNMMTDVIYSHKITEVAKLMASNSKSPIYFYIFGYKTELNWASRIVAKTPKPATSHCDELGYLFKNILNIGLIKPYSNAAIGMHRMRKLWTNFAKNGNPNSNDRLLNETWIPLSQNDFSYLNIDQNFMLKENPIPNRLFFWNSLEDCARKTLWKKCLNNIKIKI